MTATRTVRASKEERRAKFEQAREMLLRWCPRGSTVYTVLRNVSASGMQQRIDCYALTVRDGVADTVYLSGYIATFMGMRLHKDNGLVVSDWGMDMGFHIVNELSSMLYRNADGTYSHEGAYALQHRWI